LARTEFRSTDSGCSALQSWQPVTTYSILWNQRVEALSKPMHETARFQPR
jgi:hypothetical protein